MPGEIRGRTSSPAGDWWIQGVAPLASLHVALFLTLQARPGPLGVVLWKWGPPTLVLANAVLLGVALVSALRGRQTFSWRRTIGFAGLCLLVATTTIYRTYPSSYDDAPSEVEFLLPLGGPITVAWGGPTPRVNYHVGAPAERWAYDLLITKDGVSHQGTGTRLSDYYAYDQPISAPAAGRVMVVHDGDPDAALGEPRPEHGGGNRIVIEVAPAQYLTLAHLRSGTILVAPGQQVKQGDRVARVGNSGNSSEPHLHVHLQDTPVPGWGEGIPLYFSRYVVLETGTTMTRGMPRGGVRRSRYVGEVVSSLEASKP